jgi:hypothetical protein
MATEISEQERAQRRRDRRRIWGATAWYLGIIYVSQWALWFLKDSDPLWRALVGLTPMIGIALMLKAIVLAHRDSDELQRRIDGEAAVIAACMVGLAAFAYGLVLAALGAKSQPALPAMFVGPALIGVWGLSKQLLTRHYG